MYAINFNNFWNENKADPRIILYSNDTPGTNESPSNQAAIYKQGYALKVMIAKVLEETGADKVILIGHSMGGLAIREYLQRTDNGTTGTPHTWWIDHNSDDGHKVAKVVTIGTPHLGSNAYFPGIPEIVGVDMQSEAVRDLRWSYPVIGIPELDGVYLFGGSENDLSEYGFYNTDVNCNGFVNLVLSGVCEAISSNTYNPNMPLPNNLEYTWITSDWITWNGDVVVDLDRQWLYDNDNDPVPTGVTDTLLTDKAHWDETSDSVSLIRGLDEPDTHELSYILSDGTSAFNRNIKGIITYQTYYNPLDVDFYRVDLPVAGDIRINILGINSGITSLTLLDNSQTPIELINTFPGTIEQQLSVGTYYLRVVGDADPNTWQNPYTLTVDFSEGVAPPSPVLISPIDGTNNVSQSPTLDWESVSEADSYNLQVSTDQFFINIILAEDNIQYSNYNLDGLELNTTYYWRVSATNIYGTSSWSSPFSFTTRATPTTVYIPGGTLTGNNVWTANNLYVLQGSLTIGVSSTLSIEPGTIIKFDGGYGISIQGTLISDCTPENKIVFTHIKDDSYGGDTNGDGSDSGPQPGMWEGLYFRDGSSSSSVIDNCIIQYGGEQGYSAYVYALIRCDNVSPQITNNILRFSNYVGITCENGSSPTIQNNLIEDIERDGIECISSSPTINSNVITRTGKTTGNGITNSSTTDLISAQQNWWGSATGSLDNSDDRTTGGWYNPNGLGDCVSDYVDYTNWLTEYNSNELIARTLTPNVGISSTTTFGQTNLTIIGDVSVASSITVSFINLPPQAGTFPSEIEIVSRYFWDVRNSGTTFTNGNVSVPLTALEGVVVPEDLVWLKRDNSGDDWINIGESISNDNLINTIALDSFSEFAIGSTTDLNPLPVELLSFIVKIKKETVHLTWITSTEMNNYGFEVQRSSETKTVWNKIGFVDGSGNSSSQKEYSFVDKHPIGASGFSYRLKQIDIDGKYSYSSVVKINLSLKEFKLFQNYPNPFNPATTIKFSLPLASKVSMVVYNSLGEEITKLVDKECETGYYEVDFNASNLSSGIYFYRITAGDYVDVKKMLLLK